MRVNISGNNPISGENMKWVIDELNKEYANLGLKVKNLTCYIRFQDEVGRTVEPLSDGLEIIKDINIKTTKETKNEIV